MVKEQFKESENGSGFMSARVKGLHKYTRTADGKVGVIYSDGKGVFITISPDDIIWNEMETEVSTKRLIKNLTLKDNVATRQIP